MVVALPNMAGSDKTIVLYRAVTRAMPTTSSVEVGGSAHEQVRLIAPQSLVTSNV